jgi:outer membrane protein TolC
MKKTRLFFVIFLFYQTLFAQSGKTLSEYLLIAHQNNPAIKENINLQKIALLQNKLIKEQYQSPQINFTTDYLFAPFFNSNGHPINITSTPGEKAWGYEAGATNGGLYSALLNVSAQLFNGRTVKALQNQNLLSNTSLDIKSRQIFHDLDKTLTDQYITAYQTQLQISYLGKIITLIEDRKKVVSALVEKGLMSQNDYLLLEIELNKTQYDMQQQHIAFINSLAQLNASCGIYDTNYYYLNEPILLQTRPVSNFSYQKKFEADSLIIKAEAKAFNTKYLPQLSVFGNAGLNATDIRNVPRNFGLSAGLHLNIPIYDGNQKKSFEQQNLLYLQSLQNYKYSSSVLVLNERNSIQQQIEATQQSISLIENQLKNQEILLTIIKEKLLLGQVSAMDYVNSIQDYATANQNKVQAKTNLWILINQYNYINW